MTPQSVKEAMKAHHMCVIVPTYNNAATLGTVVEGVLEYCADVIVVNDGCTDNTREILDSYGDRITVVTFDRNRGKGRALRAGFIVAMARGMDYAVTIDSDGQHRVSDIPTMVAASIENPGALVVEDRNLNSPDKPVRNTFANKFSNFWFRLLTGHRLVDTQTGYRVYPLRRLHGLRLMTSRYEAEVGLLVMASWHGVKIVSQPVDVYYPPKEERVTHFRQGRDFTRISFMYGSLIHHAGFIPNTDGWEAMLPRIRNAVADGYSVAVFPEGTRSADMRVHRFHQGAFYAARELNLDIVPMTLHGTGHYMPKRDFLVRESEITLKIGQRRAPETDLLLRKEASAYRTLIQESYSAICRCKETATFFKAETAMRYAWTGWCNG